MSVAPAEDQSALPQSLPRPPSSFARVPRRKTLKTKSHSSPFLKYFHCGWKNCLINNTWHFTYLFITTVSISYRAAHMQSSLFLFFFFCFCATAPWLPLNSTFQMLIYLFQFWHQSNLLMNDALHFPCHVENIKILAPHEEDVLTYWKCKILETTWWLRLVISAYFLARLLVVAARHLRTSFLPTAFEYLHNIGWQRQLPPWGWISSLFNDTCFF